jgi:broad specificity phosphatase PhoE
LYNFYVRDFKQGRGMKRLIKISLGLVFACLCILPMFNGLQAQESSPMTHILLVRHGQTDWNVEKKFQGSTDMPLNEVGHDQAYRLAEGLTKRLEMFNRESGRKAHLSAIYSSNMIRAKQTAAILAEQFALEAVAEEAFREISGGEAEGLTKKEAEELYGAQKRHLDKLYPDRHERWNHSHYPGAETKNQLLGRFKPRLQEIASRHVGDTIIVVSHGSVIGTFISDLRDVHEVDSINNCSVVELYYHPTAEGQPFTFVAVHPLESLIAE